MQSTPNSRLVRASRFAEPSGNRSQYLVDKPLQLDSPGLNDLLRPLFHRFLGRTVYVEHANRAVEAAMVHLGGGKLPNMQLPFHLVDGLPRYIAEKYGHLLPRMKTSEIGVLEFYNDYAPTELLEFSTELRFSLGSTGALLIDIQLPQEHSKFVPVRILDFTSFNEWLTRRFAPLGTGYVGRTGYAGGMGYFGGMISTRTRPLLHYSSGNWNWVTWQEIDEEIDAMARLMTRPNRRHSGFRP